MFTQIDKLKSVVSPTIPSTQADAKHVAVLMGGMSSEREVSLSSGQGIVTHLQAQGYRVTPIDMGRDIAEVLIRIKPDVVYNALHGSYGENGCIPGLLEILNIPYTHSGVLASSIGLDKVKSRHIFSANGLKCAEGIVIKKSDRPTTDPLPRPYVIKPISEGSSLGIHIIFEGDNFDIRDYDFAYGDEVLVEKFIPGREIQVAVVNDQAIGTLEIIPKGRFYDYQAKYTEGMAEHIVPAPLSDKATKLVLDLAIKAHHLIGCQGMSRVEFRYNEEESEDSFYILELNTHPGMTPLSIMPEIAAYHGISYGELVKSLVEEAIQKHAKQSCAV